MLTMPSILQVWNLLKALGYQALDARWNEQLQAVRIGARALNPNIPETTLKQASEWYLDTFGELLSYCSWIQEPTDITRPIYFG